MVNDNNRPPTHNPETKSSIPRQRQRPTPDVMATIQTGQTARLINGILKSAKTHKPMIFNFDFMAIIFK